MSEDALTLGEEKTIRKSYKTTVIKTATGVDDSSEEAIAYVPDFVILVTVVLLENSLAVLSSGVMCEDMAYSCD